MNGDLTAGYLGEDNPDVQRASAGLADSTTPGGRLVFHVFAALAEFPASSSSRAPAPA